LSTSQNISRTSLLANDEVNDWKHLSEKLEEYENNVEHIANIEKLFVIISVTNENLSQPSSRGEFVCICISQASYEKGIEVCKRNL